MNDDKRTHNAENTNVLLHTANNVPLNEEIRIHNYSKRRYLTKREILDLVESKFNQGITIIDVKNRFNIGKTEAQRTIKYFHTIGLLFTAQDLTNEGLEFPFMRNSNPQHYYTTSKKFEIVDQKSIIFTILIAYTIFLLAQINESDLIKRKRKTRMRMRMKIQRGEYE